MGKGFGDVFFSTRMLHVLTIRTHFAIRFVFSVLGGPLLNMGDYVNYLKKTGVDTEYWRQVGDLLEIYETFIEDYLACYYARTLVSVGTPITCIVFLRENVSRKGL